jgi:hypothetical protein
MKLPAKNSFTGDLTITDANGAVVLSMTGMTIPAGNAADLDLGQLSDGVYSVKLSSNEVTYTGRIIIK